jgi:hypothetical protein
MPRLRLWKLTATGPHVRCCGLRDKPRHGTQGSVARHPAQELEIGRQG